MKEQGDKQMTETEIFTYEGLYYELLGNCPEIPNNCTVPGNRRAVMMNG